MDDPAAVTRADVTTAVLEAPDAAAQTKRGWPWTRAEPYMPLPGLLQPERAHPRCAKKPGPITGVFIAGVFCGGMGVAILTTMVLLAIFGRWDLTVTFLAGMIATTVMFLMALVLRRCLRKVGRGREGLIRLEGEELADVERAIPKEPIIRT